MDGERTDRSIEAYSEMLAWEGTDRSRPPQVRALLQVWAAPPSPRWPHPSRCRWVGSSRCWWSAWSSMRPPLALRAPSGSPLATAAPWTPSPTALPRLQTAPGLAWPSSPCPRRSWHPGKPWSVTPGLGLGIIARAHSPYSCQVGTEPGPCECSLPLSLTLDPGFGGKEGRPRPWGHEGCPSDDQQGKGVPGLRAGTPEALRPGICNCDISLKSRL